MRIFALQTDVNELKKQFMLQGEEEILTTTRHPLIFFVKMLPATVVMLPLLLVFATALVYAESTLILFFAEILLGAVAVIYAYFILRAYIAWQFNFLIVTAEKIVIIEQISFFHQNVDPIHLDNVASTKYKTQFFGIWRCGVVHISMKESKDASNRDIALPYLPHPDLITGAIENTMSLVKQKAHTQDIVEQLPKIEEVQQKVEAQMPTASA